MFTATHIHELLPEVRCLDKAAPPPPARFGQIGHPRDGTEALNLPRNVTIDRSALEASRSLAHDRRSS